MALNERQSSSKAAFMRTMLNHPERLKGKTIEEAYAGMRRQVGYNNANKSKYNGPRGDTLGPTVPASYNGKPKVGPTPHKNSPGLLGGPNAKISPAAVERRLGGRPKNNGDKVDAQISSAAKKVMKALMQSGKFH